MIGFTARGKSMIMFYS